MKIRCVATLLALIASPSLCGSWTTVKGVTFKCEVTGSDRSAMI